MNKNEDELIFGTNKWFVLNYDASYNCVVIDFLGRMKPSYLLTQRYNEAVIAAQSDDERFPLKKSDAFCLMRQKTPRLFELKHISELTDSDELECDTVFESVSVVVLHASNLANGNFENEQDEIDFYKESDILAFTLTTKSAILDNDITRKHPNGEKIFTCCAVVDIAGHGMLASITMMSLGNNFDRKKIKKSEPEYSDESKQLMDEIERGFSFDINGINLN